MEEAPALREDPLLALGRDILHLIVSLLPPKQLMKCSLVSKGWRDVCSADLIWEPVCQQSWAGKIASHNPACQRSDLTAKRRWLFAEADRKRTQLTLEELTTFVWKFRYTLQVLCRGGHRRRA